LTHILVLVLLGDTGYVAVHRKNELCELSKIEHALLDIMALVADLLDQGDYFIRT
jgi:hypothetical protein